MNESSASPFRVDGFFALRTPLVPFSEYRRWTAPLTASRAPTEVSDAACQKDREQLRATLREFVGRPEIREALFLASPTLDKSIDHWLESPDGERGRSAEPVIVRYLQRVVHRCTPFGLFAGHSMGRFDSATRLTLPGWQACHRRTRFDFGFLIRLADAALTTSLRATALLRPNSSMYRAADRMRYMEYTVNQDGFRRYTLVSVEPSDYLIATLERAANGATLASLTEALVANDKVTFEEADGFVKELIDAQVLTLDIEPRITGRDATDEFIAALNAGADTKEWGLALRAAATSMAEIDREGIGHRPDRYHAIAARLESLPIPIDPGKLWQVDMFKPASQFTLSESVAQEIERGLALIRRITPSSKSDSLATFRESFRARYGHRWLPLMEVLDPESGVGFPVRAESAAGDAPLLAGFQFDRRTEPLEKSWSPREVFLLKRLHALASAQQREWQLNDEDVRALDEGVATRTLPDAAAAVVVLCAAGEGPVERGEYTIHFKGCFGPPGVRMLGRFCYGDDELNAHTQAHLRREEAYRRNAIFAELVHLPQGRNGNMLVRPVMREYEIPFLGRSGALSDKQISLTDLLVSVVDDRVVLYSKTNKKEVVPRLTSALSFSITLGVSQFLGALDRQNAQNWLGWTWGALTPERFLPRVTFGRIVLSKASWAVDAAEFKVIVDASGNERFRRVQAWRSKRALPRFCALVDNENEMLLDLDNILSIDSFCDLVYRRRSFRLEECFLGDDELPAHGGDGDRYTHELVVPLLRAPDPNEAVRRVIAPPTESIVAIDAIPGSDWLYCKLYGGKATSDSVLCDAVAPAIATLKERGVIDGWFFIRYSDPDPHLRLRLRGNSMRLGAAALPELHNRLHSLIGGRLWRVELGTYQREVERYGGAAAIDYAERLFELDSEAAMTITAACRGDQGAVPRWQLALVGADRWLCDFGLGLDARRAFAHKARDGYVKELRIERRILQGWFAERYRKERKSIESLLKAESKSNAVVAGVGSEPALAIGLDALMQRSRAALPTLNALRQLSQDAALTRGLDEIAHSLIHMFCNRVLRSAQRTQEAVIYEFLARLYDSEWARSRAAQRVATPQNMCLPD